MLSVMIHVQNREKLLAQCLENIKDWADDIVVVDDFSTDKSREIAREYGCRVYTLRSDDFSEKDNFTKDRCKNEWVFLMDVDEHLPDEIKKEIKKAIKSNPKENLFYVKRKEYFLHRYIFSQWQPRLFRRDKVVWTNVVHEIPVFEGNPGYMKKGHYDHFPPQDINSRVVKIKNYTNFDVAELLKKEKKISKLALLFLMIFKPLQAFLGLYFYYRCFRGGFPGFIFSVHYAMYKFLIYAKYYEKVYIFKNTE